MTTQNTLNIGTPSILALIQRITEDFSTHVEFEDGDSEVVKSAQLVIDQAKEKLDDLGKTVDALALNADLSDEGKRKRAVELVATGYSGLSFVAKAAETRQAAMDDARGRLLATPSAKAGEVVSFLQESEIRRRLSAMSEPERMVLIAQAIANKNVAVERALLEDPLGQSWIPQDYLDRLRQEHTEATQGEAWQRVKTLEYVHARLALLGTALDLGLKGFGKLPAFSGTTTRAVDLKTKDTSQAPAKSPVADRVPLGGVEALK